MTKTLLLYVAFFQSSWGVAFPLLSVKENEAFAQAEDPVLGRDKVSPCRLIDRKGEQVSSREVFFHSSFTCLCIPGALQSTLNCGL